MMLYKKMVDNICKAGIAAEDFCATFGLHPYQHLSPAVAEHATALFLGLPVSGMLGSLSMAGMSCGQYSTACSVVLQCVVSPFSCLLPYASLIPAHSKCLELGHGCRPRR